MSQIQSEADLVDCSSTGGVGEGSVSAEGVEESVGMSEGSGEGEGSETAAGAGEGLGEMAVIPLSRMLESLELDREMVVELGEGAVVWVILVEAEDAPLDVADRMLEGGDVTEGGKVCGEIK